MELTVRRITDAADLDKMTAWMYEWWGRADRRPAEAVRAFMAHSLQAVRLPATYGLYRDGCLVGMYQFTLEDLFVRPDIYPWLANVYIDPAERGKGCGRALLESVKRCAAEAGLKEIFLYTHHANLYDKFGWEYLGEIDTGTEPRIQHLYRMEISRPEESLLLYHTAPGEIPEPDVRRGRKNADLGQGFYTTPDRDFALRWASPRPGEEPRINAYELDTEGLKILTLPRDRTWFDALRGNRSGAGDSLPEADVILGPVANDTICDTFGILTSGLLSPEKALAVLMTGPEYRQAVIRTEKAARRLRFLASRKITGEETEAAGAAKKREEEAFQTAAAAILTQ